MSSTNLALLGMTDTFAPRHIGPSADDVAKMLYTLGLASLDQLIAETVPANIRQTTPLDLPLPLTEKEALDELREMVGKNQLFRSFIGMGYYQTLTPSVILRNILENPRWYTQYTPYQAEISQGRMEALLNFQTMIMELTGMQMANASLLDEGTAAAEAMTLVLRAQPSQSHANLFFVSSLCHPQTIDLVRTRAEPLGIEVVIGDHREYAFDRPTFGVLVQYPASNGDIYNYTSFAERAHAHGASVVVAADLLALTLLTPPGQWGADVVIGTTQRFGVPMGYGGPHAAYMATKDGLKRLIPGRLIGVSLDSQGNPALRLTLQTREQHIRRDRATSNICTAQVLLAIMASMYAVYHGPQGLQRIAQRVQLLTAILAQALREAGYTLNATPLFDTVTVQGGDSAEIIARATAKRINLRHNADGTLGISLDEATTLEELTTLLHLFSADDRPIAEIASELSLDYGELARNTPYLTQSVFHRYHSETEMLRYITKLQERDLSLANAMIPLGSCTMKLNAATEMLPITWPEIAHLHPFVPRQQAEGYSELFGRLERWLAEITGFAAVSLQPNSGAQGEYAGLLTIRAYHLARGETQRTICLIPSSAHGTNPASAVMVGMKVVVVACDERGNIDMADLRAKTEKHSAELAALMVTYPSTHGVFESTIREISALIHQHGGQLYMDGANMNAQVGLTSPGLIGADVCHLNLHKTFCIPHGGGGPGVGPICVAEHLTPYLPNHPVIPVGGEASHGSVSAAPFGSAGILPIPYLYIRMMGGEGLTQASKIAILNANYIAQRLSDYYPILYTGEQGRVAHECIIDVRGLKDSADITPDDIAKRLIDYGFHAPTMSWPVAGTLMIEPTESESLAEIDRFCEAMIAIRHEIAATERGEVAVAESILRQAPHTAGMIVSELWNRPYSREQAAFPTAATRQAKFWPFVGRVDNVYGDRHIVCSCEPLESYH